MAQLSDETLFCGALPGVWRPLLELLSELDRLVEWGVDGAAISAERHQMASALRLRMLDEARGVDEELPSTLRADSPAFRRWFSEAVLLWPSFGDSCGRVLLDTLKSGRLPDSLADFQATDVEREALRHKNLVKLVSSRVRILGNKSRIPVKIPAWRLKKRGSK